MLAHSGLETHFFLLHMQFFTHKIISPERENKAAACTHFRWSTLESSGVNQSWCRCLVVCTLQQCQISSKVQLFSKSTCAWLWGFISLWILFGFGFHKVQFSSWITASWWLSGYLPVGFPPEPIPSSFSPFTTAGRKKKDKLWDSGHARLWLVLLSLGSHRHHQQWLLFGQACLTNRRVLTPGLWHGLEEVTGCNTGVTSPSWYPVPHCTQHQVPQHWCKISVVGIVMSVEQL